ncbi:BTAD domain-containing putative transcriptional regulator [Dactylosporangium sp. NPDC049525]|uniref:BTAD domain-containing putative transcriptional regulator n=1 Tax=Dactylosporangium sp. NPDC049525 TaxID=3154730 RepID=UPI0034163B3E
MFPSPRPAADDDAPLRLRDLGSLRIDVDGVETTAGGAKPARILSTLLINANRRVSSDGLLQAVWGEQATASAAHTLNSHVWRLRQVMEPHRAPRQPPTYLVNDTGGYRLIVNPDNVDSLRFTQLAEQGDDLLLSGDPARALDRYGRALQLWRGQPFEAVADEEWAAAPIARLTELYAHVNEQRVEALLRIGERDRAIVALEELTARLPYRERLWSQLMLALYQSGRIEEAVGAYRRARELLLDDMGLDPGPELQRLHQRILEQDPTLAPAPAAAPARPPSRAPQLHLPVRLSALIGREAELERLTRLVQRYPLVTLVGAAGCGKTRLAIEVARTAATGSPDGVWFVDLAAVEDPDAVVDAVVSTIGIEARPVGGAAAAVRSYVRDRQVLMVLDNCEHVLPAVRRLLEELLTEDAQCRMLATSREPVGIDGEVLWSLAPLTVRAAADGPSPAAQLFRSKAESLDPTFELTAATAGDVDAICVAVDGIPLAIELAAGRIRSASPAEIRREVTADLAALARVGHQPVEHHQTVDLSIEWSTRLLPEQERTLHTRLSVLPGVFTVEAARAVAGFDPVPPGEVPTLLAQLAHRSLTAVVPADRPGRPTRFRQLATVRAHAARMLATTGDEDLALERRTAWLRELTDRRPGVRTEDTDGWYARVEDNHDTVAAVLHRTLVDEPEPAGTHLTARLAQYWFYWGRMTEGTRFMDAALTASDADPADLALTRLAQAYALALRDRADLAAPLIHEALRSAAAVDTDELVNGLVGAAWCAWVRDSTSLDFIDAEVRARAGNDPATTLYADLLDAKTALRADGPAAVGARAAELLHRSLHQGNLQAAWLCAWLGVLCALLVGDPATGRDLLRRIDDYHRRLGGTLTANLVEFEANFAVLAGGLLEAARLFGRARQLAFRAGTPWPISPATEPMLTQLRAALPPGEYEQAWREGEATT